MHQKFQILEYGGHIVDNPASKTKKRIKKGSKAGGRKRRIWEKFNLKARITDEATKKRSAYQAIGNKTKQKPTSPRCNFKD